MSKTIVVLFTQESPTVVRILARLQSHFGMERVIPAVGRLPSSIDHCVIVVLLSKTQVAESDKGGGLPVDSFALWETTGLDTALDNNCLVLPILIDNIVMPPHTTIPERFQKIAFKHALPIRCGEELDRDVGRLISDLEQHLQYRAVNIFAWDNWLIPIGMIGTLVCMPFLVLWLWDAMFWNHAYLSAARFREACWWLTGVGPMLLGFFLMTMSCGFAYRRHRQTLLARASHFYTGQGLLPVEESRWVSVARIFTWISLGWGWWAGVVAVASLAVALFRSAKYQAVKPVWSLIGFVLTISICASAWGLWRDLYVGQLEIALNENDLGRACLDKGDFKAAKGHFDSAIGQYPKLARSYESLGLWYARQQQNEAAYQEFSRAISLYNDGDRGLFGPDNDQIVGTYRYRAQLAQALGKADLAKADEQRISDLTPFMDIFGGMFRFW